MRLSLAPVRAQPTAGEVIDRLRAFSVLSDSGEIWSEVRYTLRNRRQQSLGLDLPPGTSLRSVLLDGEPLRPIRDASGHISLPLPRSEADQTITLQILIAGQISPPRWLGEFASRAASRGAAGFELGVDRGSSRTFSACSLAFCCFPAFASWGSAASVQPGIARRVSCETARLAFPSVSDSVLRLQPQPRALVCGLSARRCFSRSPAAGFSFFTSFSSWRSSSVFRWQADRARR